MSKTCSREREYTITLKKERERRRWKRECHNTQLRNRKSSKGGEGKPNRCSKTFHTNFPNLGNFEKSNKLKNRHFQLLQCCSLSFAPSLLVCYFHMVFPYSSWWKKMRIPKQNGACIGGRGVRVEIIANFSLMNFLDFYLLHSFVVVVVSFAPL